MALSNEQSANNLLEMIEKLSIPIGRVQKKRLLELSFVNINGYECTFPNIQGIDRFGIQVSKAWFPPTSNKEQRPTIKRRKLNREFSIDVTLIPMKHKLFAIHYSQLRENALLLEKERGKWFKMQTWGMRIDETNECYHWQDNEKIFPLKAIRSIDDIIHITEQVEPIAQDLNKPDRVSTDTYRILRDTRLARTIKSLYDNRCQICGNVIRFDNGSSYSECHHIKPLGSPHNGPDVEDNIICLCPNHHALLDYGGVKLDQSEFKTPSKHSISRDYVAYHNGEIYRS